MITVMEGGKGQGSPC